MANQRGFEEAVALAQDGKFTDRIGVHLNLNFGAPLSNLPGALRSADGDLAVPQMRLHAPGDWISAVENELRAQVARVVGAGIRPTHFDSHEHWLNSFPWTRAALRVAQEFGVSRIRVARNMYYHRSPAKTGFKLLYNSWLGMKGVRRVRRFADVKPWYLDVSRSGVTPRGPVELMCHPGATFQTPIDGLQTESELLLSDRFAQCLTGIQLVSYAGL